MSVGAALPQTVVLTALVGILTCFLLFASCRSRLPSLNGVSNRFRAVFTSPDSSLQGFTHYSNRVSRLLQTHPSSSKEVEAALRELQEKHPVPATEIVGSEIWGKAFLRIDSHLKPSYDDAVSNILRAGRVFDSTEERFLRLLLTHRCGWSGTSPNHVNDEWVKYVQAVYPQIEGLSPVLDSCVWPEEIGQYPEGRYRFDPSFLLLANSKSYYILVRDELGLYCAGESLGDVYEGMKKGRFHGNKQGDWEPLDYNRKYYQMDDRDYFPSYGVLREGDKRMSLVRELKEFRKY